LALAGPASAQIQTFSSGSDGSFGPIDVINNTVIQVPEDGVINATTINVNSSRTLSFTPNSRNTPVKLLATGDVTIAGFVQVDGRPGSTVTAGIAGPGGFDGGFPSGVLAAGAGQGPGGGVPGTNAVGEDPASAGQGEYGGRTGVNVPTPNDGTLYGSPLIVPLVGGSGGAGTSAGHGGGGGGGAIVIASDTRIALSGTGRVRALGGLGAGTSNHGSGGAVRLVAPVVTVASNARIEVTGGGSGQNQAGHGRARIDTLDRSGISTNVFQPTSAVPGSIGSFMVVDPVPLPRLDIIAAAGQVIAEDSGPVQVILPNGTPSTQPVTIQARDFQGVIDIEVVVTPENGDRSVVPAQIDMGTGNPAQVVVNVEIPANTAAFIQVWRR
jgi:hypothetical protein